MRYGQYGQFETRNAIMNFLSDDELARVSDVGMSKDLADGDEYVDLERLDCGMQRAGGASTLGRVLAKKAVTVRTWKRIINQLAASTRR
jgi:hypothetical protein